MRSTVKILYVHSVTSSMEKPPEATENLRFLSFGKMSLWQIEVRVASAGKCTIVLLSAFVVYYAIIASIH